MTPSIGGAACCASATPTTSVQARRAKPTRYVCGIFISFSLIVFSFSLGSASDECEDVRINYVRVRGHHAVRIARVNFERALLEELGLQQCSVFVGNDLVIVALHHQSWRRDRFQIVGLVGLREGLDTFVVSECTARHPL